MICIHRFVLLKATFSPDSSMVIAGSDNGSLFLWDAESGQLTSSLPSNETGINSCFWGETGVMTCDRLGCATLWG
jgi:WD40 repeat protein